MKKKQGKSAKGGVALSTLGEKLKSSNPEVAEHFEAIKGMELSVPRMVQVIEDLLPYFYLLNSLLNPCSFVKDLCVYT